MAEQLKNSQIIGHAVPGARRVSAASRRWRTPRGGHITTFMLFAMPLALLAMALVLNWLFSGMVNRRTQHLDDTLARTAVVALLDEEVLHDMPADDTDDQSDASALTMTYLDFNNSALAARLQPELADLTITPGRADDVTMPITGGNFDTTLMCDGATPDCDPYNTLRIKIQRPRTGANPVELIMRNIQGAPDRVDIFTVAYASLDSRLTGFAPAAARPTPLVPLAILDTAWFTDRPASADDTTNANGRFELDIDLNDEAGGNSSGSAVAPGGALVDFDDAAPIGFGDMPGQITGGVFPADLAGGSIMATAGSPLMNVGTQSSPAGGSSAAIIAAFNTVAGSADPRRIFPLFNNNNFDPGEANLIGFVGATVLSASDIGAGNNQIRVRVEPNFIVHVTATTDPSVDENLYIHKIRLTR